MKIFHTYALKYFKKGLQVVPITPKKKAPIVKDWQSINFEDEISKYGHFGIGLKTGEDSGVVCLDIDIVDPKFKKIVEDIIDSISPSPVIRVGNKDKPAARFYAYSGEINKLKIGKKGLSEAIELLTNGQQVVIPPTIHPDFNYRYEWTKEDLSTFNLEHLPPMNPELWPELEKAYNLFYSNVKPVKGTGEGRHLTLVNIAGAMIGRNEPIEDIIKELLSYDKENHENQYFTDKTKTHKGKGYSSALKMVTSVLDTHTNKGNIYNPNKLTLNFKPESVEVPVEKPKKYKKLPKLPGLGKVIFDDFYAHSPVPRSQFNFMSVLNLVSMCLGNKMSLRGTYGNLYQYGVAPSSYGKDFAFKESKNILSQFSTCGLVGGTSPTSESVVLAQLERDREKCFFVNEAESILKKITDDRSNFGLRECLTDLYDYGGKRFHAKVLMNVGPAGKKTEEIGEVFSPFVNLLMTSTIEGFEKHSALNLFQTGFGSRILFYFEDRFKRQVFQETYKYTPIPEIMDGLKKVLGNDGQRLPQDSSLEIKTIDAEITSEANLFYRELFEKIENEKDENKDSRFLGLISRKLLFINKLALLHHTMSQPETYLFKKVKKESYAWSERAVSAILNNMVISLEETVSESEYGRQSNKILRYISTRTKKKKATLMKEIDKRFSSIPRDPRRKIIKDLMCQGVIIETKETEFWSI